MAEPMFVGIGLARETSELVPPSEPAVQPDFARALAAAHEQAGFDAVLVGESSSSPDAPTIASQLLTTARTFGVVVTVRPSLVAPTYAARALAGLDAFHPARVAVHLPDVISDAEPRRDGDWHERPARQRRRAEFAELVQRAWSADRPVEHDGEFYRVSGAWSAVRPQHALPLWVSGASAASDELAARRADVYLLPAERPRALAERVRVVRGRAGARPVRFGLRLRPIVRATRTAADDAAERVLRVRHGAVLPRASALAAVTGAVDGFGPLVGTVAEVAATLHRYRSLGIDVLHLSGYEPLADAVRYGDLVEAVRAPRVLAYVSE